MSGAVVVCVNVSLGGVPKRSVDGAYVDENGLEGDGHFDLVHHGGAERAVSAFSLEVIQRLAREGHPIAPGTTGENLTIQGLDWSDVVPGARLRIGSDVILEAASFAPPCKTIRASFVGGDYKRISHKLHPDESRVYFRVVSPGRISPGDAIVLEVDPRRLSSPPSTD